MDDAISRHGVMDEISKQQTYKMFEGEDAVYLDANDVGSVIASMPSIQPERKKGTWIDHTDEGYIECPFCGSATNCDGDISELHYCFSCGADMSPDRFTTQNIGPEEISAEDARRILTEWREQNEH